MLKIERLHKLSDIPPDEWNRLLSSSYTNEVFLTSQWLSCWWDCFSDGRELLVLVARESEDLVGIAPLMINHKTVEFISAGDSDYSDFIVKQGKLDDILTAFFEYLDKLRGYKRISLENIPENSPTIGFLREKTGKNLKSIEKVSDECPSLKITDNDEFVSKCLNKNTIKKRFNQFSKRGELTYHQPQSSNEIASELDTFFEFHEDRRILVGDESKFLDNSYRNFYSCLVEKLIPEHWMRFEMLKLDSVPLAHHFGFIYNNKVYHYTTTINHDYAKRSPGLVLLKFLIEDCRDKNITELDYLRGNESWKKPFSDSIKRNISFEFFRSTLDWNLSKGILNVKNSIKAKSPSLYGKFKKFTRANIFSKIKSETGRVLKRHGFFKIIWMIIQLVIPKIFLSLNVVLYRKILSERDPWTPGDFLIREGFYSDLKRFITHDTYVQINHFLKSGFERLQKGDRLFVVEKDGKIIHHSWATYAKRIYIIDIDDYYDFDEESWWMYHSYTSNGYRGLGIYTAVLRFVADTVADEGAKYLYGHVVLSNFIPHKGISKTGAVPVAYKKLTRILGINFRSSGTIKNGA